MMLTIENISAGYGKKKVLHGISTVFEQGLNYCILGPNGCGKTTLLRVLTGLLPSEGEIRFNGREMQSMSRLERARTVALMSQLTRSAFSYSVYDTVMLGRYHHIRSRIFGQPDKSDRDIVEKYIRSLDLWSLRNESIDSLSGGQRQRVFLAQTLAQEPDVILMDEPTNHLDLKNQIDLLDSLRSWLQNGERIVVVVLHDINLALRFSDSVLMMKEGRVVASGPFTDKITASVLREVYGVDVAQFMNESWAAWRSVRPQ